MSILEFLGIRIKNKTEEEREVQQTTIISVDEKELYKFTFKDKTHAKSV